MSELMKECHFVPYKDKMICRVCGKCEGGCENCASTRGCTYQPVEKGLYYSETQYYHGLHSDDCCYCDRKDREIKQLRTRLDELHKYLQTIKKISEEFEGVFDTRTTRIKEEATKAERYHSGKEVDCQVFSRWDLQLNMDETLPPGTLEMRTPDGRVLGRIENIGGSRN